MTAAITTPRTRAASLFVAAFNIAHEDNPRMTITLHMRSGSRLSIAGVRDNHRIRFDPAEVATMMAWLTSAVVTDEHAVITVMTDRDNEGWWTKGWAWRVGTGTALDFHGASRYFDTRVSLAGAEHQHVTIGTHVVDLSVIDVTTLLTNDVRAVIQAHAEPERPVTGPWCPDGAITVRAEEADGWHG